MAKQSILDTLRSVWDWLFYALDLSIRLYTSVISQKKTNNKSCTGLIMTSTLLLCYLIVSFLGINETIHSFRSTGSGSAFLWGATTNTGHKSEECIHGMKVASQPLFCTKQKCTVKARTTVMAERPLHLMGLRHIDTLKQRLSKANKLACSDSKKLRSKEHFSTF